MEKDSYSSCLSAISKIIFATLCIGIGVGACSYFNKKMGKEPDWVGEEILEDVIESYLGIEIDLTPMSPE